MRKIGCSFTPIVTEKSIAKVWKWQSRVLPKAFERLELLMGKLIRAVLRGRGDGNIISLPDHFHKLRAKHTGKLPFALQPVVQRLGDKDLPTRQGKGVDRLLVGQQMAFKWIITLGDIRDGDELATDRIDGGLACLV